MLDGGIEYTPPMSQVEALVQSYLTGVLVDFPLDDERRFSPSGVDFDDTI